MYYKGKLKLPKNIETRLAKIKELNENWDSYSAKRVSRKVIEDATSLLKKAIIHCGVSLVENIFIAPCSDGGIQLEWAYGLGNELIVKVSPLKRTTFLLVASSGEKEGTIQNQEEWEKIFNDFCRGKIKC